MHAVTTTTENIALHIALYPIGYTVVDKGEESAIREKGLPRIDLYVKCISVVVSAVSILCGFLTVCAHIVDGLESSMFPLPRIQSVSVTYTIFSSGEKQIPFGRPNPSAMARMPLVEGTYRYT